MKRIFFDILSISSLLGFASLLFLTKGEILFNIGGSFGFVILIGIAYYISSIKKQSIIPLRIISLICWCLIALNYVAYKELTDGLSIEIIISSVILLLVLNFLLCFLIFQLVKKPDIYSRTAIELWKHGAGLLYFRLLSPIAIYVTGTFIVFWVHKNDKLIAEHIARFLPSVLLLMIIFYLFAIAKLKKDEGKSFRYFFTGEQNIEEIKVIWKQFFPIVLGIVVLANFIEFIRRMWLFNLLTWVLFLYVLIYIYRFSENLFKKSAEDVNQTEVNLDLLPFLSNPNFFRKTIIFHAIFGTLYLISLGLFFIILGAKK
ncbi:MAG: hypothetical protein AB1414_19510 [bacterium]